MDYSLNSVLFKKNHNLFVLVLMYYYIWTFPISTVQP